MLPSFVAIVALIGSSLAAIATLPSTQEFATSTSSLANVDGLLAFPSELGTSTSNSETNAGNGVNTSNQQKEFSASECGKATNMERKKKQIFLKQN